MTTCLWVLLVYSDACGGGQDLALCTDSFLGIQSAEADAALRPQLLHPATRWRPCIGKALAELKRWADQAQKNSRAKRDLNSSVASTSL